MTNFLDEVAEHILYNFEQYLKINNITLTEAAELLSISKGQLSHLFKKERKLNDLIGHRMIQMTRGKRPNSRGGIYGIYFNDEIIYIGQTVNFKSRWAAHKTAIKNNKNDDQPLHQCGLDINKISFKILFDSSKLKLFPSELNRIESIFISNILPEWNTHLNEIHGYNLSNKEKIQTLTQHYYIKQQNMLNELNEQYSIGITDDGNKELIKTLNYTAQQVLQRAISIVKNTKQYLLNPEPLNFTIEEIMGENNYGR